MLHAGGGPYRHICSRNHVVQQDRHPVQTHPFIVDSCPSLNCHLFPCSMALGHVHPQACQLLEPRDPNPHTSLRCIVPEPMLQVSHGRIGKQLLLAGAQGVQQLCKGVIGGRQEGGCDVGRVHLICAGIHFSAQTAHPSIDNIQLQNPVLSMRNNILLWGMLARKLPHSICRMTSCMCVSAHCTAAKLPLCQASPEATLSTSADTTSVSCLLIERPMMLTIMSLYSIRPLSESKTDGI